MNTNAKPLSIPVSHRPMLNGVWLAIASVLRWVNRDYGYFEYYELRLHMGELTKDEARAEILSDWANAERNRLAEEFWTSGGG